MKIQALTACLGIALFLPACKKPAEVTVDEERPLTMRDEKVTLDATSNARFGDPGAAAGPFVAGQVPQGWLEAPTNQFRLLNYRFGAGGEVAVGLSSGGLTDNINRWLGQFGQEPINDGAVAQLEKGTIFGIEGVWVEAQGDYAPGMGQSQKSAQALYGFIAQEAGRVITVKMTGPSEEVAAQKEALKVFVAALQRRE
ncbi:hypothetical protein OKA04_15900 [Luteolibacter flavescens]|uniref:DUF1795 domain-containing protein n=1 Tax=Luteolibacter flavescens TaxID=1859460 RepID=A0ABT3FSK8_9BACT|nr:hypothetical protein [Luteolibacter flavescens]MCW1886221.1 hypothetical protein [Luteolibacter flavescens]